MFFDKTSSLRESFASLTLMLNLSQLGCKAEMITSQSDCLHEVAMFMMSFSILSDSSSDLKSYVPMFKMTLSGFSSVEGLTKVWFPLNACVLVMIFPFEISSAT